MVPQLPAVAPHHCCRQACHITWLPRLLRWHCGMVQGRAGGLNVLVWGLGVAGLSSSASGRASLEPSRGLSATSPHATAHPTAKPQTPGPGSARAAPPVPGPPACCAGSPGCTTSAWRPAGWGSERCCHTQRRTPSSPRRCGGAAAGGWRAPPRRRSRLRGAGQAGRQTGGEGARGVRNAGAQVGASHSASRSALLGWSADHAWWWPSRCMHTLRRPATKRASSSWR